MMKRGVWIGVLSAMLLCGIAGGVRSAAAEPRQHDGFYLQLTTGVGYYSMSASSAAGDESFSGMTIPISLMMGGSVMKGLAIGGGFFVDRAGSPTYEANGMTPAGMPDFTQYVIGIGGFADYYIKPAGGLHFQGFVGWGGVETSNNGNVSGSDPTGLVMSIGAGYDWFLSNELSAGVMGRVSYGMFSINNIDTPTIAPAIVGTLSWQ
jgi:hypothetical protein